MIEWNGEENNLGGVRPVTWGRGKGNEIYPWGMVLNLCNLLTAGLDELLIV